MLNRTTTIKSLRKNLEAGMLLGIATPKSGIKSPETLARWKKESHENRLGRLIEVARSRGQGRRDDMVEDAQFKRLVEGRASGSEYEFYLINRRPDRWKKEFQFTGPSGAPFLPQAPIINYISVPVTIQTAETKPIVDDSEPHLNGNGNGRIPHV